MSELLYVLALHPSLPIHVLLSVPSTAIFLDTLSFVEPASVDMTILDAGKARGSGAVGAILRVCPSPEMFGSDVPTEDGWERHGAITES